MIPVNQVPGSFWISEVVAAVELDQDYNIGMASAGSKRQPEAPPPERHPAAPVYALETTGLLVIALLILILTLARYWHNIAWSAR